MANISARLRFRRHLALWALSTLLVVLQTKSCPRLVAAQTGPELNLIISHRSDSDIRNSSSTDSRLADSRADSDLDFNFDDSSEREKDQSPTPTESRKKRSTSGSIGSFSFSFNGGPDGSTHRMNDDDDDFNLIEALLSLISPLFPTINLTYAINSGRNFQLDKLDLDVENYYEQRWTSFGPNLTLDELQLLSVKAALRMTPMPIHTSWGYASRDELKLSSLPVQDEARCSAHLNQLSGRLDRLLSISTTAGQQQQSAHQVHPGNPLSSSMGPGPQSMAPQSEPKMGALSKAAFEATPVENYEAQMLYRSSDVEFMRYLDTFGHVPTDVLRGNVKWYGSYSGCLDTKLAANPRLPGGTRRIKFRYCMAALKSVSWASFEAPSELDYLNRSSWKNFGVHTYDLNRKNYFIRVGLCLPESCDSGAFDYQENVRNIEKLAKFNLMKPYNSDHYYLADLYCLPDERSPLRSLPLLGKLLIIGSLGWMSLIALATMIHLNVDRFYTKAVDEIRRRQRAGLSSHSDSGSQDRDDQYDNNEYKESDVLHLKHYWIRFNVYLMDNSSNLIKGVDLIGCLSLYSNWLRYTNKLKLAVAQLHNQQERRERIRLRNQQLVEEARKGNKVPSGLNSAAATGPNADQDNVDELEAESIKLRVDTSSLNALKVVALLWIIAGHCIFYLGSAISNGAILMHYARDLAAFALANGAMYITELFFVITGCLTTYLAFKYNTFKYEPFSAAGRGATGSAQNNGETGPQDGTLRSSDLEMSRLRNRRQSRLDLGQVYMESRVFKTPFWLMIIASRYLRIVPTYLLVYAYVKLVGVYWGGRGQTWDYAVSENSMRRLCVQESWLPVLTLTSNFVEIYNHCIVGGWYLSTDMQFMVMAVPLLMLLAHCMRRSSSTCAGKPTLAGVFSTNKDAAGSLTTFTKSSASAASNQQQQQQQQPLTLIKQQHHANSASSGIDCPAGAENDDTTLNDPWYEASKLRNQITVNRRLMLAYGVILALGLLSAFLSILYGIYQTEVDLSYLVKFVPHIVSMLSRNIAMYTNSVFRFRAFACGLILGHLLYLYEFKLIKLPKLIQLHGAKLTTIIFSVGFGIMFLPVIYPKGRIILSHDIIAILMVLSAYGIDIFLCSLIFLICIGKAPKVVLFVLNSPFWSVLSSLSLCAFLVHTEVIVILSSQLNPPPTAQYSLLLFVFCATIIITYLLALALYLSFEMPVSRLIDSVMRRLFAHSTVVRSDNGGAGNQTSTAK